MNGNDVTAPLYESKLHLQMRARRATLMSSLGMASALEDLPVFRRRLVEPLEREFLVRHGIEREDSVVRSELDLPKAA